MRKFKHEYKEITYKGIVYLTLYIFFIVTTLASGGGGKDNGSDNPAIQSIPSYSGGLTDVLKVESSDVGEVKIKSESLAVEYNFTIVDQNGNRISGINIDYYEVDGNSVIHFFDPLGQYTSALIYAPPNDINNIMKGNKGLGELSIRNINRLNTENASGQIRIEPITIAAIILLVAVAASSASFVLNVKEVKTFYRSDHVVGTDVYCKTFEEIAEWISARVGAALNLGSIFISFVTFGVGAGSGAAASASTVEITRNSLLEAGVTKLYDFFIEYSIEKWGVTQEEIVGHPVAVKIYPVEENAFAANLRNIWADYEIIKDHPSCQQGAITWYFDSDNDGYGNLSITTQASTQPAGFVPNSSDCNDGNPNINPGATDIPDDGIDQDCNGSDAISGGGGGDSNYPNRVIDVIPTAFNFDDIVVTPDGNYIYTSDALKDVVVVIRTSDYTVIDTINMVGSAPKPLAVTPNGSYIYVANLFGDPVEVIRTSDNMVIDTISVGSGSGISAIAVTPNGSYVYLGNNYDHTVEVIRTSDNTVIDTISTGINSTRLAITPDGKYVYISNFRNDTVSVIRTSDNTVIDTISVGDYPGELVVTPNGRYAYVANVYDSTISVIRTSDNTVIDTISVRDFPGELVVTPNGSHVYVCIGNDSISVIRTSDNTVIDTITIDDKSGTIAALGMAPNGNYVYVSKGYTIYVLGY